MAIMSSSPSCKVGPSSSHGLGRPTPQQCLLLPLLWKCEGCYFWRAGWISLACISARKEVFLEEEDK